VSDVPARRTPLHDLHVAAGARMVDFAGWRMPVQYTGVLDEHKAVRTRAGLFDVSHMGEVRVRGARAEAYLQHVTCNDVSRLEPGRAQYTGLMTPEGTFVDDMLIYRLAAEEFLVVINAANRTKDVAWLERHAAAFDVELRDESDDWALLALQGPAAQSILAPLAPHADLPDVRYYAFTRTDVCGADVLLSRTGYTGEDGFELYAPADAAATLWTAIVEGGRRDGLVAAGLGARDTLRLEARLVLYGQDIDETTTPWEAGVGFIVKLAKGEFLGRDVLVRQKERGVRRKLVGFELRDRGIARHGHDIVDGTGAIGRVTSGAFAPWLGKSIGLGYVPAERAAVGTELRVDIRGRDAAAVVVPTPFYQRKL
jgi:aminomethyltransferase